MQALIEPPRTSRRCLRALAVLAWWVPSLLGVAAAAPPSSVPPAASVTSPGQPLASLTAQERERFARGRAAFERAYSIADGLGPLFNDVSCNRCHNRKGVGGAGIQSARLAGRLDGARFDPLTRQGGPVLAANTLMLEPATELQRHVPRCRLTRSGEPAPDGANVMARRRTTPLFGLGLVEATPDRVFLDLARRQPAAIRGRPARVRDLASGELRVGKYGWKAQAPTLAQFAGLALFLELGVTSTQFPDEQPPFGDAAWLSDCDAVADPELDGREIERLTDFMRLLAPISPLDRDADARAGSALFTQLGCDGCHVRELRSGPSSVAALDRQRYAPYSDFLLHDMGGLGDGVAEADAGPREMRTAPLWGLRLMGPSRLLHDGRARSYEAAVEGHDGQAAPARDLFRAASPTERRQIVAFLSTL